MAACAPAGEAAQPAASPAGFDALPEEVLVLFLDRFLPARDAARFAAVCTRFRAAKAASAWPIVRPSDGMVLPPPSGRFSARVRPGEDLQAALAACPAGGSMLLEPGLHALTPEQTLLLDSDLCLFGGGAAEIWVQPGVRAGTPDAAHAVNPATDGAAAARFVSTGARGALDGLLFSGEVSISILSGGLRMQGCELSAGQPAGISVALLGGHPISGSTAVTVSGPEAAPTIIACTISNHRIGVSFEAGAGGRLRACAIARCDVGLSVTGPDTAPSCGDLTIRDCALYGIYVDAAAVGANLGAANRLSGNGGGRPGGAVYDGRLTLD